MQHLIEAISRQTGLQVQHGKLEPMRGHIQARVKALGLDEPEDYLRCLADDSPHQAHELALLAEILTTCETFFMRDAGQMRLLRETLLPGLLARRREQGQLRLRAWSCACSTGEEAYSLAILVHDLLPDRGQWRIDLYGTDVNRTALRRAQTAVYGPWSFRGCEPGFQQCHFHPQGSHWVLREPIRQMVRFLPCDLLRDPLPDAGLGLAEMDVILCRNLFIYLDPRAIAAVTHKLAASLATEGVLMTGHGELRTHNPAHLQLEMHPQSLVYRKRGPRPPEHPQAGTLSQAGPRASLRTTRPGPPPATLPPTKPAPTLGPVPARPSAVAREIPGPTNPAAQDGIKARMPGTRPPPPSVPESDTLTNDLARAWRLADAGRLDEARDLCRGILARDPMQAEAYFLTAILAEERGEIAQAREDLRRAIYLEPAMIAAHLHLERLQTAAAETEAATRTRDTISRLLASLPSQARVPFMGDTSVGELRVHWAGAKAGNDQPAT